MSKITLSIDAFIINRAELFAKQSKRSLSEIVEAYLAKITEVDDSDSDLDSIYGIIEVSNDFDEKEEIKRILLKKHS